MRYVDALTVLETALREPLPGLRAQRQLAPIPPPDWRPVFSTASVRHAAGLLLVYPVERAAHIVLTLRADTLERHGGQISLPGGVVEAGETYEQAALREAHEEVALQTTSVRTIGPLTPVDIYVSGFRLHPVVAVTESQPELRAAVGEVARVIEVPVADLLDPRAFAWQTRMRDGVSLQAPTLQVGEVTIWGATAMVIAEFLALFGWVAPEVERS